MINAVFRKFRCTASIQFTNFVYVLKIWNFNDFLRIAAMDTLWVRPGAEGEFGQEDLEDETKIEFRMEMFEGMNYSVSRLKVLSLKHLWLDFLFFKDIDIK